MLADVRSVEATIRHLRQADKGQLQQVVVASALRLCMASQARPFID